MEVRSRLLLTTQFGCSAKFVQPIYNNIEQNTLKHHVKPCSCFLQYTLAGRTHGEDGEDGQREANQPAGSSVNMSSFLCKYIFHLQ